MRIESANCVLIFIVGMFVSSVTLAQSTSFPVIKVDLNISSRTPREVNELGYVPWGINTGSSDSINIKNVKIKFTAIGLNDTQLQTDYYKTAVQAPHYAKLAGDGVWVEGGRIEMRIKGLAAGKHTLMTYHNNTNAANANSLSPMSIFVGGKLVESNIVPTSRALKNAEAKTAYLILNAIAGKDIVICFETKKSSTLVDKRIFINGFELNTPDITNQAVLPLPKNGDEHVNIDGERFKISFTSAKNAVSHNIYFGTDSTSVANAILTSPLFVGSFKQALFSPGKLYSMLTYYWRVDEVSSSGKITKGNIWYFRPRQLAFTDAEGYGRFARGGRGGAVVEVTNLNDDGPGSLREAVSRDIGPRTIVFAVAGMITLKSRLVIDQPYVTIAGQTAPGKGICIRQAPVGIVANDAVIRFLRVRLGSGRTFDGMGITGADNSIVDHCSISWTIDEGFSSRGAHNITLQRTLISEALNIAGHSKYGTGKSHGFAASVGGEVGSFHHNLLAHCAGRNWSLAGGVDGDGNYIGKMDMRNNVVYNWDHRTTDGGAREVNFVNNYYKPGAATNYKYALNAQHENYGGGMQRYYFEGNLMEGRFDERNQSAGRTETGKKVSYKTFVDKPFFDAHVTTQSAKEAYKNVLSNVGCNQPALDDQDIRMIHETLTGTHSIIGSKSGKPGLPDSQEDVGGWERYPEEKRGANFDQDHDGLPDWWENLKGSNVESIKGDFSDSNMDADQDGFTNLDDYLDWMAHPHYLGLPGKPIIIDLKSLFRGYTDQPHYKISSPADTQTTLQENGILELESKKTGFSTVDVSVIDKTGNSSSIKLYLAIYPANQNSGRTLR